MKRVLVTLLMVSVTVAAAADKGSFVPKIRSVKMRRDNGSGGPGDEVKAFLVTDHKLHFHVELENHKLGKAVAKWVFTGVDIEAGRDVSVAHYTSSVMVAKGIDGDVMRPRDWPTGKYKAELYINGKLATTISYEIQRDTSRVKMTAVHLRRDNGKGEAGEIVKSFKPGDRTQHFEVETSGEDSNLKVSWTFTAVDTAIGKAIPITTVNSTVPESKSRILTSQVELPRDWPVGKYQAQVRVNGATLTSIDYTVE